MSIEFNILSRRGCLVSFVLDRSIAFAFATNATLVDDVLNRDALVQAIFAPFIQTEEHRENRYRFGITGQS